MDIWLVLLSAIVIAFMIHAMLPPQRIPPIIYVEAEAPQSSGFGWLVLFIGGFLLLLGLHVI
jgi:hypothetical protein